MKHTFTAVLLVQVAVLAHADTFTAPHVRVEYVGLDEEHVEAIAGVVSAAWQVYVDDFAANLPGTVITDARCARQPTRLFTDGHDHIFLTLSSTQKLAPPAKSGVFNVYGLCHELGHMMMYRLLEDRDWMTTAAAEGWAHYAGSVVIDSVHAAKGDSLWCYPYDYSSDGTARLERQLAGIQPSEVERGAGAWRELERIIDHGGFARLFRAWQAADIDPTEPTDALLAAATGAFPAKAVALKTWWKDAAPLLVEPVKASTTKAVRVSSRLLTGQPLVLAFDDDASEGKRSIAGGGHARKFTAPGNDWYLRAVSLYGARYGRPRESSKFDIALCDAEMQRIALWKKPYTTFERGQLGWERIELPPTKVPREFYICFDFHPTATKGVYVAYDDSTSGNSLVATPGKPGAPLREGDWMIRVELDQLKTADALSGE
ncbi:MAG: hypothetical protein KKB50_11875 [Planctomycetes bacterium]|nr:hypothetical protein [Planctomycetota bacterium]